MHQLSMHHQQVMFSKWAQKYGDVIYLQFFHNPVVVLDSTKAANELLEKRSAIYSSRPHATVLVDFMGWDTQTAFMPYGPTWRMHRRWLQNLLQARTISVKFRDLQYREANKLLFRLLQAPDGFLSHIRRFSAEMVMEMAYGHTATTSEDVTFIRGVETLMASLIEAEAPGATMFGLFPSLSRLPKWMPGAGPKRRFAKIRETLDDLMEASKVLVESEKAKGNSKPSFVTPLLEEATKNEPRREELEYQALGAALTLFGATIDTSTSVLSTLILALLLHPAVLRKAQEEIDRVIGTTRLPDFDDRPSLPYIECIVQEIYRWNPPAPLGLLHKSIASDIYRGYYIPKGTTVIANIWSMARDPNLYPDPEVFRPERFLEMDEKTAAAADLRKFVFGFGRRICPGRHLGDSNAWVVTATLIAAFNVQKARDAAGKEITPSVAWRSGVVSHPEAFVCNIRPRSQKASSLILQATSDIVALVEV
ncbi:cytochrome P450 [Wolfiporia cocos MD-104 SS10]|uniref:Cytochrome P450 n=1 Tax=Wolfiporia cocos (strain MD-104) TaxID=742152 RepID=A0A2H3JA08_WOLCO|nr:cytochrome P450 [Wolfiporia cocos MD-104 SS10]